MSWGMAGFEDYNCITSFSPFKFNSAGSRNLSLGRLVFLKKCCLWHSCWGRCRSPPHIINVQHFFLPTTDWIMTVCKSFNMLICFRLPAHCLCLFLGANHHRPRMLMLLNAVTAMTADCSTTTLTHIRPWTDRLDLHKRAEHLHVF